MLPGFFRVSHKRDMCASSRSVLQAVGRVSRRETHCRVAEGRQNMKRHMIIWGITVNVLVSLPLIGIADDQGGGKHSAVKESQSGQVVHTATYQPPRKGAPAPGLKRGGGTRGMNKSVPVISLLAPEHVGLTLQEQPVLYWFTPTKQDRAFSFEFTLIGDNAETPLVETKLSPAAQAGLQEIKLSDYKVKLLPGERYLWSVSLIMDAEERSANVVAKGAIERVEREKLEYPLAANFSEAEAATRYAEAGVWYDAIMAITDRIRANPANKGLREQRAAFLDQVGLSEVAKNDLMSRASN